MVVDSGGSVYEFREKASRSKRVRCVFTGSRGEASRFNQVDFLGSQCCGDSKRGAGLPSFPPPDPDYIHEKGHGLAPS